ncbi:MAG: ornithine carbamoyltransferase [Deltaproteobacteria bacterium]|nr:ornithine carbamoyltransferase [Deltaproteobacteria bacterium]
MKKDFISIADFSREEIEELLDLSSFVKKNIGKKEYTPLQGKILGMLFEKTSTRTRLSFEAGMKRLGGDAIFLFSQHTQLSKGESWADTARVLSRYVDAIMIRTFEHKKILELAKYATVPVINGLSDLLHPCQILGDIFTIKEHFKTLDVKISYIGDGNNIANSWLLGAAVMGLNLHIATPLDFSPSGFVVQKSLQIAKKTKAKITLTDDPKQAVKDAQVIYTDVWTSMGREETPLRNEMFKPYQVNNELLSHASRDFIFMHCLPAHRGKEVTDEVIDSKHSIVWQQAENRTYVQAAILIKLLEENND